MTSLRFHRSTRSPAPIPNINEGRYEIVAAMPVADFDPVKSRMSQIKASWKTESPNCEKNWALQRNAIGAGVRRGPALVASGPPGFGGFVGSVFEILLGRPGVAATGRVLVV